MKKTVCCLMVIFLLCSLMVGCGGNSLVGKWKPATASGRAPYGFPDDITFFSDGTIVLDDMNGKYFIDGKQLRLTYSWVGEVYDFKVSGNKLTLKQNDTIVDYIRIK